MTWFSLSGYPELKEFKQAFNSFDMIDFWVMLGSFLFYFIGGYLDTNQKGVIIIQSIDCIIGY